MAKYKQQNITNIHSLNEKHTKPEHISLDMERDQENMIS